MDALTSRSTPTQALERLQRTSYGHVDTSEVMLLVLRWAPSLTLLERRQLTQYVQASPAALAAPSRLLRSEVSLWDTFHALRLTLMDVLTDGAGAVVYKSPYRSPQAPTTFAEDMALARYEAEPYYWPYAKVHTRLKTHNTLPPRYTLPCSSTHFAKLIESASAMVLETNELKKRDGAKRESSRQFLKPAPVRAALLQRETHSLTHWVRRTTRFWTGRTRRGARGTTRPRGGGTGGPSTTPTMTR